MSEQISGRRGASSETTRYSVETSRGVRRYFRMQDEPLSWWPGGLLPLLGLLLLFLWGALRIAPDIQERTRESVRAVVNGAGYAGLDVSVDGQRVVVRGAAASDEEERIRSIARGATCDAFVAKNLVCPTHVALELTGPAVTRFHNFAFSRRADGLVLRGDVPDQPTKNRLVDQARSTFGAVVDSLRVTGEAGEEAFPWATGKAFDFLGRVQSGRIEWVDGVMSAVGRTGADLIDGVTEAFRNGGFPDRIGSIDLQAIEEVAQCNEQFNEALSESMIRFETASSEISSSSMNVLRRLADVAGACPGNLFVAGHTDSQGTSDTNLRLSRDRAQAVVNALVSLGVDQGRLSSAGYGEDRPIATNTTSAGRARNRRIEISVADIR